jgi:hypothetical protein
MGVKQVALVSLVFTAGTKYSPTGFRCKPKYDPLGRCLYLLVGNRQSLHSIAHTIYAKRRFTPSN